jgi:transposase
MHYVGLDVHVKTTSFCVLDETGAMVRQGKVATSAASLRTLADALLAPGGGVVAGQEVGKMAYLVHDALSSTAVKLLSFNAHHLRMIAASRKKSDRRDAFWIAKALQTGMTPTPVYIPTGEIRELRALLQQRDTVLSERVRWRVRARSLLQASGHHAGKLDAAKLAQVREQGLQRSEGLSSYIVSGLARCERMILALEHEQRAIDQELLQRAQACPQVTRLQTIPGIGPTVALAIHAAVGNIERFGTAKQLCSYAGLVPSVRQSGNSLLTSSITRQGNVQLRRLLVQAAHVLLFRCKSQHAVPLQALGLRVHAQRGRRRIAVVAAARGLLRVAYYVLRDRADYQPQRLQPRT